MTYLIKYWVETIITIITSFLALLITSFLGLRNGLRCLLKNEIIMVYETYMKLGYCPSFIKENVQDLYKNYHRLKGNGMVTSMVNDIYKLPNKIEGKNER